MVKSCCMTKLSLTLKHWLKSIMGTLRKNFINKHQTTKQKQPVIARAPQHPMHQPKANFIFNTRHLKNAHIYIAEVSKNILKLLIQVRVYYSQTLATLYFLFICMYNSLTRSNSAIPLLTPPPSSYFIFIWHTEKNTNLQSIILQISKTYSIIHNLY